MLVMLLTAVDALHLPTLHALQPTRHDAVRSRTPSMNTALKVAPREELWNEEIKKAWISAYVSAEGESDYEIDEIEGAIPAELQGTIFRNGPGNFERGGKRYEHVLDGDGLICRITIDGVSGRAHFRSRFVRTAEFEKEEEADAVLHRNTFGTQPPNWLDNVGVVALKNAANTNVQVWGGALYALWEAAPPVRLDPRTLAPLQACADLGVGLSPGLTVTTGLEQLDRIFGLGNAFTAHPRLDAARGALVGWKWTAKPDQSCLVASVYEWDEASGALLHETPCELPSAVAPHDFGVTASYYVFQLNAMSLDVLPFALGLKGPVDCLRTTGGGVTLLLVPRPGGDRRDERPVLWHPPRIRPRGGGGGRRDAGRAAHGGVAARRRGALPGRLGRRGAALRRRAHPADAPLRDDGHRAAARRRRRRRIGRGRRGAAAARVEARRGGRRVHRPPARRPALRGRRARALHLHVLLRRRPHRRLARRAVVPLPADRCAGRRRRRTPSARRSS